MDSINVITPPDKLFDQSFNFLLIYPDDYIKNELQNVIADWDTAINVYVYEPPEYDGNIDWLLSIHRMADTVILDVDNCPRKIRDLTSYFISFNKTFWLTKGEDTYYNSISLNRIYNLDSISKTIGGNFEKAKIRQQQP